MRRWERLLLAAALLAAGVLAAMVATVALAGFLYFLEPEEETDLSTQPIEVIVTEADRTCAFNVDAVAPGRHDVVVIPNDADSLVVIRDPSGKVVLRQAEEADGSSESHTVQLRLGTYDVECRTDSATMTAQLPVLSLAELGA
jgi:hypothetical protein